MSLGCTECDEPDHEAVALIRPASGLWRGRKTSAARRLSFIY